MNDRARTAAEREMVGQHAGALKAFRDADVLWKKKLDGAKRVGIADEPEIKRIALDDDYSISGTGTGAAFTFDTEEGVQALWRAGGGEVREANRLYTGEPAKDMPEPR